MKRIFLKSILAIILIIGLSTLLVIAKSNSLGEFLINYSISKISNENFSILLQSPKLSFSGVKAEKTSILIKKNAIPLFIEIQNSSLNTNIFQLIFGNNNFDLSGELYGGNLFIEYNRKNELLTGTISLKNINLELSPISNFINLTGGFLNIDIPHFELNKKELTTNEIIFDLQNLSIKNSINIPGKNLNLPLDITIPEIENLNLNSKIIATPKIITINDLSKKSSWGIITGKLKFDLINNKIINMDNFLRVILSEDGSLNFSSILTLLSSGKIDKETKEFLVQFTGSPQNPVANFKKL